MKQILSKEDFAAWAETVNYSTVNLCDLQDVFARSKMKDLKEYFMDMTQNEKELLVFSIQKAMGSANLFEFIKSYSIRKAQDYLEKESDENDRRWNKIVKKEMDFKAEKEQLRATIETLHHQLKEMTELNDQHNREASKWYMRTRELENDADIMSHKIDELTTFESHIKSLLNT